MPPDREKDAVKVRYLIGYPSLAAFFASDKDKSTVIYKRFDRLSARNLLYLQSELADLQARQDAFDEEDRRASTEVKGVASNWERFRTQAAEEGNTREKARMDLVQEIRAKLREYREAILWEKTLLSIDGPSSQTLEAFVNVFNNVSSEEGEYTTLGGNSAEIYRDRKDLISLQRPVEEDRLTSFIRYTCPWLFVKHRTNSPLTYISERRLQIFVTFINIVLTFALLFGAIYHLYRVSNPKTKIGLVAFYKVLFAFSVGLVTNARRSEVFGACAAYAAVLVVFISGNIGGSSEP